MDGVTAREQTLAGQARSGHVPRGAKLLDTPRENCAVFEDAQAGVAAGRAGGFGIVIGVDRVGQARGLLGHGADIVVQDLSDLLDPLSA